MKRTLILLCTLCTPALAQQGQAPDIEQMFFKQFDANADGRVDKSEFLKPPEAQFDHMDRNSDGALDQAEVKAFNAEMQRRMQEMRQKMQQNPQGMPRR